MYLKLFITFTILNIHCKCNYLDQLSLDCKLRRMYLSILIKTIIIIIIIIIIQYIEYTMYLYLLSGYVEYVAKKKYCKKWRIVLR